jgi:hypothetical protein
MTVGSTVTTGANRASRTPPALTKPACISAEAGVGAVIDERIHVWNGISADWIIAATTSPPAAMTAVVFGDATDGVKRSGNCRRARGRPQHREAGGD